MSETEKAKRQAMAAEAAERVQALIDQLERSEGLALDCILAGMHGHLVAMMVANLGGALTAQSCRDAATWAEQMQSAAERLAAAPTQGSA